MSVRGLEWLHPSPWQIGMQPRVDVPGQPAGADEAAFAASGMAVNASDATCIDVTIPSGDTFSVGEFGLPPTCTVNVNPAGCPFNPLLIDQKVMGLGAPQVPLSPDGPIGVLMAVLLLSGARLLVRRGTEPH